MPPAPPQPSEASATAFAPSAVAHRRSDRWVWQLECTPSPSWFPRRTAALAATAREHRPSYRVDQLPTTRPGSSSTADPTATAPLAGPATVDAVGAAATDAGDAVDAISTDASGTVATAAATAVRTAIGEVAAAGVLPPVVAESDRLTRLLAAAALVDAAMAEVLACTAALEASDEVQQLTGLSPQQWLGLHGGQTSMDRRFLRRATRLLDRLPSLADGVAAGTVSWAQLRGIVLAVRELPNGVDERLDGFVAAAIDRTADAEPDALVTVIRRAAEELAAACDPHDPDVGPGNRVVLQPSLDGRGGRLFGDLDAVALAIVDEATAPGRDQLDHPGGVAGARADNLLRRLLATDAPGSAPAPAEGAPVPAPARGAAGDVPPTHVDAAAAGEAPPHVDGDRAHGSDAGSHLPPIRLLLRMEYGSLLGEGSVPAELLTQLVGGRLRLAAPHARRLLDERGLDLRTVVVDDGAVIGVGRRTRRPPGWLSDATLVLHDQCSGPDCSRPARGADLDHATPWWSSQEAGGDTDVANLAPLCPSTNLEKEAAGWRVGQDETGRRVWHHPRSGVTVATVPATWRPPGWRALHPPGTRGRGAPAPLDPSPPAPSSGAGRSWLSDDDVPF